MPHPAWEDLDAFFQADDFAITVAIIVDGIQIATILGIFDDPTVGLAAGDYRLDQAQPVLTVKEVDCGAIHHKAVLKIEGKLWDVIGEPELDGTGVAAIRLAKPEVSWSG